MIQPRRIAIVGGGVSGLVAAAELHRAGHEITVFEAGTYAGGHTNTIAVEEPGGNIVPVDTGFIVMNDRNYPNFERILAELGVDTQPTQMSFGVSDGRGEFEWAARGARGIFARPSHLADPRFIRMLSDLVRFNREARSLLDADDPASAPSLREFLREGGYSEYFIERLIVPQASAVWSADPEQMWTFPASFLAAFFDNHGVLQLRNRPNWRTIPGGSNRYVKALTAPFADRIRLRTPVTAVRRDADGVTVAHDGGAERFDEVVLACHADQALAMLENPTPAESEILGAFPYQPNEAVLHTDTSVMPRRRAAWASWNFHLRGNANRVGRSTLTYDMNRLQSLKTDRTYLVTLNMSAEIDPDKIVRVIDYAHPIYTVEGTAAQARWHEVSGVDRIHLCGAYWRWGFHEDGAWSALRVSEALGGRGPGLGASRPVEPAARGRGAGAPGGTGVSTALASRPAAAAETRRDSGEDRAAPASGIYEGWVAHRRTSPVGHAFRYRMFMPLFDLADLPGLLDEMPLWSARRRAPARVRRPDYLGDPETPLAESARDLVAERTGVRPGGPVLMLANPRYWGVGMNPVAFYYLYGSEESTGGAGLEAMIADVTNTPWGESRSYVLRAGEGGLHGSFDKRLHVSPFMPMEQNYEWSATTPGEKLAVSIRNRSDEEGGAVIFEASIALERREITPGSMRSLLLRYPPMTIATIARIYFNAVKLKLKGAPVLQPPRGGWVMNQMNAWRRIVHAIMGRVSAGRIEVEERWPGGEKLSFGPASSELRARVLVNDPQLYGKLCRSKSIALGESYAARGWETDDLPTLLRIVARDIRKADPVRRFFAPFLLPFQRLNTIDMLNTRSGARSNISRHYDLGNDMFELFLDHETMMYSAALYESPEDTLEQAQHRRLDQICDSLDLGPDDHLLEIGTGWGGLAIHAASNRGCRVTTTTISREQQQYALERVRAAGLEHLVTVLDSDYRDLTGTFDKLVSLEMIEAVGWEWFDTYFRHCSELLKPDGLFFLQAIVIDDSAYESEKRTKSFANQVIFPGGCLPSVMSIQKSLAKGTDLRTVELDDISESYVLTLQAWRERFEKSTVRLEELGYDERFRRTWNFYLAFSEAGFAETRIRDVQMLFAKPHWSRNLNGHRSVSMDSPETVRGTG